MSTFEQELRRVREIGCPSCSSTHLWETWIMGSDGKATNGLVSITCYACEFPIWTDGDWAPELYEIGI